MSIELTGGELMDTELTGGELVDTALIGGNLMGIDLLNVDRIGARGHRRGQCHPKTAGACIECDRPGQISTNIPAAHVEEFHTGQEWKIQDPILELISCEARESQDNLVWDVTNIRGYDHAIN